jgi:predicted nucleic acid-binding protein
MILLDTDVMIDLMREYLPAIDWLDSLGTEKIVLPGLVAMELIQGCRDKAEQQEVDRELRSYNVAWPSPLACDEALSVSIIPNVTILQPYEKAIWNSTLKS